MQSKGYLTRYCLSDNEEMKKQLLMLNAKVAGR